MIGIFNACSFALVSAAILIISAPFGLAAQTGNAWNPHPGSSPVTSGVNSLAQVVDPAQRAPQTMAQRPSSTSQTGGQGGSGSTGQRGNSPRSGAEGATKTVAEATVIKVDQPDNCLRIRRGPSIHYEQIGCVKLGDKLKLSRVYSGDNRWAELDNGGWVFACQIKTDFRPPGPAASCGEPTAPRAWRGPATAGGHPTVIHERDFYNPYWGRYWRHRHHPMHPGHPKHPKHPMH